MQLQKLLDPSDQYYLDDLGRVCPIHEMGWIMHPWKDALTFDEAIEAIATSLEADAFPADDWSGVTSAEWADLVTKRYLGIEDAFFLATGVNIGYAVFRFQWRDGVFFNMRTDFAFLSLASDCGEQPINAVESAIRHRLLDYYRETEAIKRAIEFHEIEPLNLYPALWWKDFWTVRGFAMPSDPAAVTPFAMPSDPAAVTPFAIPPYLNSNHPCYSSKLAQAIDCWLALFGDEGTAVHHRGYGDQITAWLQAHNVTSDQRSLASVIQPGARGGTQQAECVKAYRNDQKKMPGT